MMKMLFFPSALVAAPVSSLPSHLPYNVTPQQALGHPEVQRRLDVSLGHLLVLADKFLSAILSSVEKIPYGFSATGLFSSAAPLWGRHLPPPPKK